MQKIKTQILELTPKSFIITIINKFKKYREEIKWMKTRFNRELEFIKEIQMGILELKN